LDKIIFTFTLLFFTLLVLNTGRNTKSSSDFSLGGRQAMSFSVTATIVGTMVGGASTIGTVQMAYTYGLAAWIFTLGCSIACLLLGLFFAAPMRNRDTITISEYIGHYFGKNFRKYSSILTSAGIFIHIIAQILASAAIIMIIFNLNLKTASFFSTILLGIFVLSGGIKSTAFVGKIKIFMLYILTFGCFLIALVKGNGLNNVISQLPEGTKWLSLFSYGSKKASIDLVSMVIGVLATQTYLQAIFSAKNVKEARKGAFISAAIIPPIGLFGVFVGMYLRVYHPEIASSNTAALPFFIQQYFPGILSDILMVFMLIIIKGTGSGLCLGIITNIYNDVLGAGKFSEKYDILKMRVIGTALLMMAFFVVLAELNNTILEWSYLSMGLRGSATFIPLIMCIFIPGITKNLYIRAVVYILPLIYLAASFIHF